MNNRRFLLQVLQCLIRVTVRCGMACAFTSLMYSTQAWAQSAFVEWQIKNAQRNIQIERKRVQPLKDSIQKLERISSGSGREARKAAAQVNMAYLAANAAVTGSTDSESLSKDSVETFAKKTVEELSKFAKKLAATMTPGVAAKLTVAASGIGTAGLVGIEALDCVTKMVEHRNAAAYARETERTWTMYKAGEIGAGSLAAERSAELVQVQQRIYNLQALIDSQKGGEIKSPKGVRIYFDDRILARFLARFEDKATNENFQAVEESLFTASSPDQIGTAFRELVNEVKSVYIYEEKKTVKIENVVLVSLKNIMDAVKMAESRRRAYPQDVSDLGGVTRIHGFILLPDKEDIVLVGSVDSGVPPVGLDSLVVALVNARTGGGAPTVSLDPDPTSKMAPQTVRVTGIPKESRFARIMLDADYMAKKILLGAPDVTVNMPTLLNLSKIFDRGKNSENRIWLTPIQQQEGEIQISSEEDIVLFETAVCVLTEKMQVVNSCFVGTGEADPIKGPYKRGMCQIIYRALC